MIPKTMDRRRKPEIMSMIAVEEHEEEGDIDWWESRKQRKKNQI
jgi:hypothetical protein